MAKLQLHNFITMMQSNFGNTFSDGCATQYQNIINLCHHKDDFGVEVKWNFFATSHGKTAGNGAAGTLKRSASRASL